VHSILIQEKLTVDREFAVRISYDGKLQMPVITYTAQGGRPILWVEKEHPDQVFKIPIEDVTKILDMRTLLKAAENLDTMTCQSSLAFLMKNLWQCFIERDCLHLEINPLIYSNNKFYAGHCFVMVDEDARFR
jgi:succinyl-CoA synthetase beta subunit